MNPQPLPTTSPTATLGSVVAEHPRAAAVFERLGLDYCCGGKEPFAAACHARGLDPATVGMMLAALDDAAATESGHAVAAASITELCDHIVTSHHEPLRRVLPRISELLHKVVRAHGDEDPDVRRLEELFAATRTELEEHMRLEEELFFPGFRALDAAGTADFDAEPLAHLEDTHAATGEALRGLRELGGDYRLDAAHCATHRVLLHTLAEFELDLHQHIHEENNVLFAKVRERMAAPA
jgi:regulator of cell morphogenesis and NO signaling